MLAGGSEHMVQMLHVGFCRLRAMTEHSGAPGEAMRPFDKTRDGFRPRRRVRFSRARRTRPRAQSRGENLRGDARARADLRGVSSDRSASRGIGYQQAMDRCLRDAGTAADEVDYINAHGSATPKERPDRDVGDQEDFRQSRASAFDQRDQTDHGASDGREWSAGDADHSARAAPSDDPSHDQSHRSGSGCDLDYVVKARPYPLRVAMNLNAGFGGRYACLLMRHFTGMRTLQIAALVATITNVLHHAAGAAE